MSPEQAKDSKHLDHRSDIYSLGVLLYYILSGKPPYDTTKLSNFDVFNKIVNESLPELSSFPEFQHVIKRATLKNIENRYSSCAEFIDDLNKAIKEPATVVATLEHGNDPVVTPKRKKNKCSVMQ